MPQNKNNDRLRGFPGYRTRENRSGLDYLDSSTEAAHMEGVFYQNLFTFRLRTRKPLYLILMFLFGVLPLIGIVVLTWTVFSESLAWMILIFSNFDHFAAHRKFCFEFLGNNRCNFLIIKTTYPYKEEKGGISQTEKRLSIDILQGIINALIKWQSR